MKIRTCDFWKWQVISLLSLCSLIAAQLKYSVLEETEPGTLVGNVVKDFGLNTLETSKRGLQLGTEESRHYFTLDLEKGVLNVKNKIDREKLCGTSLSCVLTVQLVIENPLELFHFEVEILDINDNSPTFQSKERILKITELAQVGARFPLERAHDADVGNNAVSSYKLDHNHCFSLIVQNHKGDRPSPVLVLSKSLDREEESQYQLVLTALDGGNPTRTGTILISIIVLDINDNAPFFDNAVYKISLKEHVPVNTIAIQLNATDKDEGENGKISYYFEDQTLEHIFSLDHHTGEIRVKGNVDFEEYSSYEMTVKATDHGVPEMQGYCVVQVDVEDINDNEPEIHISSVLGSIAENAPIGSTIGLLSIKDVDTGKNGEVNLKISPNLPFKITAVQNMYSIITNTLLDRENNSHYTINLIATDSGSPQLHSEKTIYLQITDINDNPPMFNNSFINIFIQENNDPGFLLSTVSASDIDEGENSHITYYILNSVVDGSPAKTFIYINQQNGDIFAQQSFDFERFQVLQFTVRAEDSGSPKLCSNITIFLYILDKNDNYPLILYPEISQDLKPHQLITKSLPIGSLVTKVIAIDADSGYNAWLSYTLIKETEPSLFKITPHTGEIRTTRRVQETDSPIQSLCILIEDNGKPPLSSTTTLIISLVDSVSKESYHSKDFLANTKESPDLTMYLVISLAAISVLSVVTFIILFAKCLNNKMGKSNCCFLKQSNSSVYLEHSQKTLQLIPNGTLKYLEVTMASSDQKNKIYTSEVNRDTLNIIKSLNFPQLKNFVNENETLSRQCDFMEQMQQAQPNTDWRFSQAQRPGTSGAQPTEEAGVWPNNQFETERLQAMILASANEAAEGTSALGGGTGTMGLSARYGPQFTLQHVPDYRQNIYIPGTTSTLTNAAGKRDGKGAGPSGNKKKSGKKEKK